MSATSTLTVTVPPKSQSPTLDEFLSFPPANFCVLPALEKQPRFVLTGNLHETLFGVVKIALDRARKRNVAIKISRKEMMHEKKSHRGVSVMEDVRREVQVLKYLNEHRTEGTNQRGNKPVMEESEMRKLEEMLKQAKISAEEKATNTTATSALSILAAAAAGPSSAAATAPPSKKEASRSDSGSSSSSSLPPPHNDDPVCRGATHLVEFIAELEDCHFHYVITNLVSGGDLHSILTTFPQHRLTEKQSRFVFRQIVLGVKHLHENHIAHLDLSLENICLDKDEQIHIIDFGVAVIHPQAASTADSTAGALIMTNPPFVFSAASASSTSIPQHTSLIGTFMCRPIFSLESMPGKIRYMSPELLQNTPWCAYANDIFCLGVILYSFLTGNPCFDAAHPNDAWFNAIFSGAWLTEGVRTQAPASIYNFLSEGALDLIDIILKPQLQRPDCDAILAHPWMMVKDEN